MMVIGLNAIWCWWIIIFDPASALKHVRGSLGLVPRFNEPTLIAGGRMYGGNLKFMFRTFSFFCGLGNGG